MSSHSHFVLKNMKTKFKQGYYSSNNIKQEKCKHGVLKTCGVLVDTRGFKKWNCCLKMIKEI